MRNVGTVTFEVIHTFVQTYGDMIGPWKNAFGSFANGFAIVHLLYGMQTK